MCSSFGKTSLLDILSTKEHKYKIVKNHCYYDLRKYNFTNWVIPICNSLPKYVIRLKQVIFLKSVFTSSDQMKNYMTTTQISAPSATIVLYNNTLYI